MAESMMDMMDAFASAYQKRSGTGGGATTANGSPWGGWNPGWPGGKLPMQMGGLGMPGGSPMSGNMPMQMGNMGMPGGMPMNWGSLPWSQGAMPSWPGGEIPWSQGTMPAWPGTQMPWTGSPVNRRAPSPGSAGSLFPDTGLSTTPAELYGSWQGKSGEVLMIGNGRFRIYRDRDNFREGLLTLEGQNRLTMQDPASGNVRRYEYAVHQGKLALRDEAGNLFLYRRSE